MCPIGMACDDAHALEELLNRGERKTEWCIQFRRNGKCTWGELCRNAHTEDELRWEPFTREILDVLPEWAFYTNDGGMALDYRKYQCNRQVYRGGMPMLEVTRKPEVKPVQQPAPNVDSNTDFPSLDSASSRTTLRYERRVASPTHPGVVLSVLEWVVGDGEHPLSLDNSRYKFVPLCKPLPLYHAGSVW